MRGSVVSGEGEGQAGQAGVGLAPGCRAPGCSGCLVSGPGAIRAGAQWPLCESPFREVAGGMGSGLVELHWNGTVCGDYLLSLGNG